MAESIQCIFCQVSGSSEILEENDLAFAVYDKFPVTKGPIFIIPKRHFPDFFDITSDEHQAVFVLLKMMRSRLLASDPSIDGFNVGINAGTAAGQTVPHCHIHLIPRRSGDIDIPRGGVRGVIPEKRVY